MWGLRSEVGRLCDGPQQVWVGNVVSVREPVVDDAVKGVNLECGILANKDCNVFASCRFLSIVLVVELLQGRRRLIVVSVPHTTGRNRNRVIVRGFAVGG